MRRLIWAAACVAALGCGGAGSGVDAGAEAGRPQLWGDAGVAFDSCKVPAQAQPTLSDCEASCYEQATCIEIDGRLMNPQPGEADGGTLYSLLDVCLASCR